jgi:protein SCO1/2
MTSAKLNLRAPVLGGMACAFFLSFLVINAAAQSLPPAPNPVLKGIGIDQHLQQQIPPTLVFRDEAGSQVTIKDLERGKPVILILVQFGCPSLCTTILNDALSTLKVIPQTVGNEYDVWVVSFDPKETPQLAAEKKGNYLRSYARTRPNATGASAGWHFLTGTAENIGQLTKTVGYRYRWDPGTHQFVHPAALVMLTPEGRISRYFFGVDYDPTDVRLSLVEASNGRIGTVTDKILLFCYHYDPATGRYGLAVANALRIGASLMILLLGTSLVLLWRADRRRTRRLLSELHATRQGGTP